MSTKISTYRSTCTLSCKGTHLVERKDLIKVWMYSRIRGSIFITGGLNTGGEC